jgi:hypothetical protein
MILEGKQDFNINLKIKNMNKLATLKVIEVTSQRQADNGTICFHDPITNCDYISYESGYIRRKTTTKCWRNGKTIFSIYQLNPTRMVKEWSDWAGRDFERKERILIHNPNYRLELLARAVVNYRNTVKSYKLS